MSQPSFSNDEAESESDASAPRIEDAPVYAENPDDNEFNHRLIIATERCLAYSVLLEREEHRRACVALGQFESDRLAGQLRRYRNRTVPALTDFIREKQELLDTWERDLEETKSIFADAAAKAQQCSTERRKALTRLYAGSQRFINNFLTEGPEAVAPRIEIDQDFCRTLAELTHQDHWVAASQSTLKEIRRQLLREPAAPSNPFQQNDRRKRRRLLDRLQAQEDQLRTQRQSQMDKEQEFFLGVVHQQLRDARIMPSRGSSFSSGDSGSLSPLQSDSTGEEGQENRALIPDEPEPPELREVFERKADLAKAISALENLRSKYAGRLADFLITFTDRPKPVFDDLWERDIAGERYEAQEAAATAAVTAAEAAYEVALQEAQEAGITPLPPSPRDTGNKSEDGAAGSENSVVWAERDNSKHKPGTRAWIKDVAKSGSPISSSTAPARPRGGVSKLPKGNVKPNFGFIGECKPKRTRIDRYENHQKAMQRRVKEMEKERKRREGVRAAAATATAPAAAEPRARGWWCGVQ